MDLRGAGLSGKPDGSHTTELLADDVAAFMQAAGIGQAHIFGLSLGAATGMWLAARHPEQVEDAVAAQRLAPPPTRSCAPSSRAGRSSPRRLASVPR